MTNEPISILLCALGGEGGGVLTDWLVETARHAGYPVQATSVPGVAQRTGATTYYLELLPVPEAQLQGRRPVFGLNPLPGRLDVLVSSELLETARQIGNGYASADHTRIISARDRTLTTLEKMGLGDGRLDDAPLLALLQQHSRDCHVLDMAALTREAGTVVSAVMLGALAASGVLPMQRADYEAVLSEGRAEAQRTSSQRASLRGFALAWDALARQQTQVAFVDGLLADTATAARVPAPTSGTTPAHAPMAVPAHASASATPARAVTTSAPTTTTHTTEPTPTCDPALAVRLAALPNATQDLVTLGVGRLIEYQNTAYAALYLDRLQDLPTHDADGQTTRETARWLALWMAFDDIVRVADLKSRDARWQRIRAEVRAGDAEVLKVYDHFKPGVPEFAALLPALLADTLLRWERARVARGKPALALPLKIARHSVHGWLALRLLASFKWLRPFGQRYAQEQAAIEQWLAAVRDGQRRDAALGLALARCGQLVKGYGSTNARSHDSLQHILRHLATRTDFASAQEQAKAIDAARQAALQDEAGQSFDQVMRTHGAPHRPVREQPIRWLRRRPAHPEKHR